MKILGEVAYGHGVNFNEVIESLNYQANGYCSDFIHPRFVACMLRLGDVLDVDDKRFNMFYLEAFDKKIPHVTDFHIKKHASVEHLLINESSIEVTLDCPDENTYRVSRDWFDWVLKEGENQTHNWQDIAPSDLGGFAPIIKEEKIKIYFKGEVPPADFLNLKFSISNEKALSLLKGGALYEKTEFVFIREVVQNSLDSIKVQIWKDIENGIYDSILYKHLIGEQSGQRKKKIENKHEEIVRAIVFPDDLPDDLINSYSIHLKISWMDKDKNMLKLVFKDNGCGISEKEIVRMSKKVGESKTKEKEHKEFIARMPFFLKPTGSFGIGLQSLFLVSDHFLIKTKSEGERGKEIIFRNPTMGNYSSVSFLEDFNQRGTELSIEIKSEELEEKFNDSFTFDVIGQSDYFVDGGETLYLYKIIEFTYSNLQYVPFFKVSAQDIGDWESAGKINTALFQGNEKDKIEDSRVLSQLLKDEDSYFFRYVENKSKIGSEVVLCIKDNFKDFQNERSDFNFFVRNIKVKSDWSFRFSPFSNTYWNLLGPSSDELLNVSRDKFQRGSRSKILNIYFDKIYPDLILKANDFIIREFEKAKGQDKISLQIIYFKIALILSSEPVYKSDLIKWNIIDDLILPLEIISNINFDEEYGVEKFKNLKRICIIMPGYNSGRSTLYNNQDFLKLLKPFTEIYKNENCEGIIRYDRYLELYLNSNYIIKSIYEKGQECRFVVLEKIENEPKEMIEISLGRDEILRGLVSINSSNRASRTMIYSVKEYAQNLAIKNRQFSGFDHFPSYSKSCIISPFMSKQHFQDLFKVIKEGNSNRDKEITKSLLRDQGDNLFPPLLINSILEDSYFKGENLTKEKIINTYIELIIEFFDLVWEEKI
jgi:hypothetical protein